ncbi:hypothetical protein CHS0354_009913 [Potamilus streckersoni]|uniref:Uncharacterized protein n=1 Tax=Potamilus streckersoni TaxID=2493646 RepID=A0AAE0TDN0_9BIVA|nr:hypothetical protein CHS0354_009913 [Potamilus streckersoni]
MMIVPQRVTTPVLVINSSIAVYCALYDNGMSDIAVGLFKEYPKQLGMLASDFIKDKSVVME